MRFSEDKPDVQDRARSEVAAWRETHPDGTEDQMLAALSGKFHKDYPPVLRAVLFTMDRSLERQDTAARR